MRVGGWAGLYSRGTEAAQTVGHEHLGGCICQHLLALPCLSAISHTRVQRSLHHPLPSPLPVCSELLLFLLPLLNVKALKRMLRSHLPRLPLLGGAAAGGLASGGPGAAAGGGGLGNRQPCGICNAAELLQPWAAVPCGHTFCYYCLRSHCLADPQYSCPLCLSRVTAMQRVSLPSGASESSSSREEDSGGGSSGDKG